MEIRNTFEPTGSAGLEMPFQRIPDVRKLENGTTTMKTNWFGRCNSNCWQVAVLGGFITLANLGDAQPLTDQAAPALQWQAVASSADANLLLAAANTASPANSSNAPVASIYTSTNAGVTWNPTPAPTDLWQSVAMCADGTKMIAAASMSLQTGDPPTISGDGLIYLSTNSGANWMPGTAPNNAWSCVAASADGTRLVAAASVLRSYGGAVLSGDGLIYRSTNSGTSWYATSAPSDNWKSIACSSDGTRLVAAVDISVNTNAGLIYVSTNSGSTWMQTRTGNGFTSVASSADGARLVAADPCACLWNGFECIGFCCCTLDNQQIYVSTNSGATWTASGAPAARWQSVVSSADGLTLAAAYTFTFSPGGVSLSQDGGANWATAGLDGHSWTAISCSADGQRLVAASLNGQLTTLPYVGPWHTATAPATSWAAVTSSGDGKKLVATDGAQIYRSTDSGISWSMTSAPFQFCSSILSSGDGTRLVAVTSTSPNYIYTSTNSGTTWTGTNLPQTAAATYTLYSLGMSADGARLVASAAYGQLYTSTNFGAAFIPTGPTNLWSSVASSADGIRLVATSQSVNLGDGLIYVSTNSGASWTPTSAPATNWTLVASSADGTQLVAVGGYFYGDVVCCQFQGLIYISRDSGASWGTTTAPLEAWNSLVSSADGTRLVAVAYGLLYVSTDSGRTWTINAPVTDWSIGTISADGSNIVALSDSGLAGILHWPLPQSSPASPVLSIARSGGYPLLSWLVPSTRLTLQQTSELTSINWVDSTNQPTFNFNNLRNEVTLPQSPGHTFYRLKRK
jgi:hypothetical protein